MNNEYLERAKQVIPDAKTLIVLASKRAADLASGKSRATIKSDKDMDNFLDIALLEIAEGHIIADFPKAGSNTIIDELAALRDAKNNAAAPLDIPGE